jgi:glutathione S-transferase
VSLVVAEPLRVVVFVPGLWGLPSASPFGSKLVMWLRMAGIPHRLEQPRGRPASKTGKIPYVFLPDGSILDDSSRIIEHLTRGRGVELERGLSASDRAKGRAIQHLAEDSLYWSITYSRWLTADGWALTKDAYFGRLPALVKPLLLPLLRKQVRRQLHGHGLGRHDEARIWEIARADVDALDALLDDGEFFLGQPTAVDASVWGMVASLVRGPFEDPVSEHVRSKPRLVAFAKRMEERYPREAPSS